MLLVIQSACVKSNTVIYHDGGLLIKPRFKDASTYINPSSDYEVYFGPRVLFRGSLVVFLVRPFVRLWSVHGLSVFKYPRNGSLVFSDFLHEVRAP